MFDFVQVAYAASSYSSSPSGSELAVFGIIGIVMMVWYILWLVQAILGYGTAYRKTKANGDNGVSLFGWMIVYSLAAMVPGLGIYLWSKSREPQQPVQQVPYYGQPQPWQQPQGQPMPPAQPVQPIQPAQPVQPAPTSPSAPEQNPPTQQ